MADPPRPQPRALLHGLSRRLRRDGSFVPREPGPTDVRRPAVVIVGAGFGGLTAAKTLRDVDAAVVVVDQHNHHVFQPLLYQVATGALATTDIASPIRSILGRQRNARVLLARAETVDLDGRRVALADGEVAYDYLVLAAGARTSYFAHPEWQPAAPGLKTIDDAVEIRRRLFLAFEEAERTPDEADRRRLLTFVVVGGGPTGVEMAGAIAEIVRDTLPSEFRSIDPGQTRVVLVEGGDHLLRELPGKLSASARRDLERLGVEIRTGARVTRVEPGAVWLGVERVEAATVVWAAGIEPSPLGRSLGVPLDRSGRVCVEADLSVPGHPEAFVVGDLAAMRGRRGEPLPGTAPVAIQAGRAAAENVRRLIAGQPTVPFRYRDRGVMATIGRNRAVAVVFGVPFDGFPAWAAWALVHVISLVEFRSRVAVTLQWAWTYVTRQRVARLITTAPTAQPTAEPVDGIGDRHARPAPADPHGRVPSAVPPPPAVLPPSLDLPGAPHA